MTFTLLYSPQAKDGLQKLFEAGLKNIAEKALLKISVNPFSGKKLLGKLDGLYSTRVTRKYRIIYRITSDKSTILILSISHRKESYR
jgi:addiction module RelE/StbE family toxin